MSNGKTKKRGPHMMKQLRMAHKLWAAVIFIVLMLVAVVCLVVVKPF